MAAQQCVCNTKKTSLSGQWRVHDDKTYSQDGCNRRLLCQRLSRCRILVQEWMSTTVKTQLYTQQQRRCENMSVHATGYMNSYIHRGTHIQGCCCHEQKNCPITTNTRRKLVNQSFSIHAVTCHIEQRKQSQQPFWWQQQEDDRTAGYEDSTPTTLG